jgi:hypothetical protein
MSERSSWLKSPTPMMCPLGPRLPILPPPRKLEPLVFQIAAVPSSFCHNRSTTLSV